VKLSFLVAIPKGEGVEWLKAVRRWRLGSAVERRRLDLALARWCWKKARSFGGEPVGVGWRPVGEWERRLALAKVAVERAFKEELAGGAVKWSFDVGRPGRMWVERKAVLRSEEEEVGEVKKRRIRKLVRAANLLCKIRDGGGRQVLKCTRGSGRAAVNEQRRRGEKTFCCSAEGGGLVMHEPFLREVLAGGVGTVVVQNRDRLGRSAWRGVKGVLEEAGLEVKVGRGGGKDAAGRTNRLRRAVSGLEGAVAVPGWLGVGERVGEVGLVVGAVARRVLCGGGVSAGDDWRAESLVLRWALAGVDAPVRLLGFCGGASRRVRGSK
jgi:hypothetical protein